MAERCAYQLNCHHTHLIVCDRSSPWARSVLQWGCRQHAHIALFAALRWLGLRGLGVLFLTLKRVHTQPFPRIPGRGRSQKVAASIFVIIRGSSGGSRVCALGRRARDIAHRAPPGPARHLCRVPWLHVADIVVEYTRDVRHLFNRVYSPCTSSSHAFRLGHAQQGASIGRNPVYGMQPIFSPKRRVLRSSSCKLH